MNSNIDIQKIAALPRLIQEALDRRKKIREERDVVRTSEDNLRQAITKFTSESNGSVSFTYPGTIPPSIASAVASVQKALETLGGAHRSYIEEKNAHSHARGALNQAEQAFNSAKATALQLKQRWFGIHFLQSFFVENYDELLSKALNEESRQQEALQAAQRQMQEAEGKPQIADARLQEARTESLQALQIEQEASQQYFSFMLDADAKQWATTVAHMPPFFRCDWTEDAWRSYDLTLSCRVPFWVTGMAEEQAGDSRANFFVPSLSPLLGSKRATIIKGNGASAQSLMQGLVLQLATMLPYGATFTLLDPSGAGRAFPMQRGLPFVRPVGADLARELDPILEDIARIIRSYLDAETQSFEALPEQIQANERYEFIVAANFPSGYDRRTIEILQKIAKNGSVAGKYVFLQLSSEKDLPRDLRWDDFGDIMTIDADNPPPVKGMGKARMKTLRAPEGQSQKIVMARLAAAKPPESNVQWSAISDANSANWWTEDASTMIQAPVGSSGRDRLLNLWFGVNRDGRPCAHGILGAMPGSGKSNLYHVLVCGLAVRYGPEELNFYLIDGKMGVEFQPYRRLPHARVVALNSAPELSRSVLAELLAEMERRNEAFGKLGVVDLPGYRKLGSPLGPRPRIVLMIDEYQELFEDDRHNQASSQLLTLAQQGRSVGIHLLLGSQRFGAAGMLNQAAVFGSIHLRLAMRMSQADVQGLMEFGRNGKRLVEQCDLPGKIVINANSGDDNSNEFGKVALMSADERTAVINALVAKADREWPAERRFATVVFDGREQPNFSENPQMVDLIRLPQRPSAAAWRKIATAPVHEQGFGVPDWYAGERPLALWLGQELNVHGQARIILRRRGMENVLLVGENLGAAYGMLATMLSSLAVNEESEGVRIWIVDRALPETPWEGMIETVSAKVLDPLGYQTQRTREPRQSLEWLGQWRAELDRRANLDEDELQRQPTWLLALMGVDRIPQLARTTSNYGAAIDSPDGEKLRVLYTRGPTLGLHVLLTFASASTLKQCLDRAQLEHFKHRVVTQMAEADSFLLLGNDQAAKLQRGEARPVFAICHDQTGGNTSKFKPYIVEAQIPWPEQLQFLTQNLNRWKENSHVNG